MARGIYLSSSSRRGYLREVARQACEDVRQMHKQRRRVRGDGGYTPYQISEAKKACTKAKRALRAALPKTERRKRRKG